jgi:hypothetical protein
MKKNFLKTRVVYNAAELTYEVQYYKWLMWRYHCQYSVDNFGKERAKELAIEKAKAILEDEVVWES